MRVSAVLTCHNEAAFIAEAVRSVSNQTARDQLAEIIVVNDGSTDHSASVLERLTREEPLLRVITTRGIRLPAARNLGISHATGDIIALLDGDDIWEPTKLERQLPAFALGDRIGLVYSDYIDFSTDGDQPMLVRVRRFHSTQRDTLEDYFVNDGPIVPSAMLIRASVLEDVGLFDETMKVSEDTEMCLRIAERWQFQYVPGGLMRKRRHGRNVTHRLDVFIPSALALTARYTARHPSLARLVGRRMARRYARFGNDCSQKGENRRALELLSKAVIASPLYARSYAYLLFMLVPPRVRRGAWRQAVKLYHRLGASTAPQDARLFQRS